MELIIGGAFQGKLTYAAEKYEFEADELCDLSIVLPTEGQKCCYHLEAYSKTACREGLSLEDALNALMPGQMEAIVSREIGNGIVPMDGFERAWREFHGALLRELAKRAGSVTRVICGIPEALK